MKIQKTGRTLGRNYEAVVNFQARLYQYDISVSVTVVGCHTSVDDRLLVMAPVNYSQDIWFWPPSDHGFTALDPTRSYRFVSERNLTLPLCPMESVS